MPMYESFLKLAFISLALFPYVFSATIRFAVRKLAFVNVSVR